MGKLIEAERITCQKPVLVWVKTWEDFDILFCSQGGKLAFCHFVSGGRDTILKLEAKYFHYLPHHQNCDLHVLSWFLIPSDPLGACRCTQYVDAVQAVKLASLQVESVGILCLYRKQEQSIFCLMEDAPF